jgi:hypothetical protein
MTARRMSILLALLALAAPAGAAAQGLGDTAARQREKRAKQAQEKKPEARAFTDADLAVGRPPAAKGSGATASSAPAPEATGGGGEAPAEPAQLAEEQPYIQAVRSAQEQLASVEARIQELSAKLNPMSGSFIYGSQGSNSANEEAQVRAGLSQAEAQLLVARQAVAAANESIQDFRRRRPSSPSMVY